MGTDTTADSKEVTSEFEPAGDNYLNHSKGIMSWIFTLDHKRIAIMYMGSISVAMLLGGLFACLRIRTRL